MSFIKHAGVQVIASAKFDDSSSSGFVRLAEKTATTPRSYYVDGARKIDVRTILSKVGDKYSISKDPSDYIFEAIRANTTNVPNENHDAFHKSELLRFDLKIGKPVYRTYEEKPHHVNHKTENPKTARGVIVDSHYFDETPPLDNCPSCNSLTKEASSRDESGVHCKKCGTIVKDEFVEILVAVDQKKDPTFANAVRVGQLNSGSMGCNCESTTCNVCRHVAYSIPEFCEHIKRGNKGNYWLRDSEEKTGWRRVEAKWVKSELEKRGRKFVPSDFTHALWAPETDGKTAAQALPVFEVRKSFEQCNWVEFEEYSRVDQPADPKARQREILNPRMASKQAEYDPQSLKLETEALLLRAKLSEIEGRIAKTAQMLPEDDSAQSEDAGLDVSSEIHVHTPEGDHIEAPDGSQVLVGPGGQIQEPQEAPAPGMEQQQPQQPGPADPNALPGNPQNQDQQWTPEALGILPPSAAGALHTRRSKQETDMSIKKATRPLFNRDYGDFYAEVTAEGNALVVSPAGPVLVVRAGKSLTQENERVEFGRTVLATLESEGLVATIRNFDGSLSPKFAQILDAAIDDMKGSGPRSEAPVIDSRSNDMAGAQPASSSLPGPITEKGALDMRETRSPSDSSIKDRADDRANVEPKSKDSLDTLKDGEDDMRDSIRPNKSVGKDDVLDGSETDMDGGRKASKEAAKVAPAIPTDSPENLVEQWRNLSTLIPEGKKAVISTEEALDARYRKLLATKVDQLRKEADEREVAAEKRAYERMARAIKVIARRHLLDHEDSPLKIAAYDVLTTPQIVGMDGMSGEELIVGPIGSDLAVHLVQRAWSEGQTQEIDRLLSRAAELAKSDDKYLADAEADLSKQASSVPTLNSREQLGLDSDSAEADSMHRAASSGNLHLAPSPEIDGGTAGHDKRSALREVLDSRPSKTNISLSQFRPN